MERASLIAIVAATSLVACGRMLPTDECASSGTCDDVAADDNGDPLPTSPPPAPTLSEMVAVDPVPPPPPSIIEPPIPIQPEPAGPPPEEVTITTDTFTVPVGGERFICQNFANPFGGNTVDVIESEHTMAEGSHHMFAFQKEGLTNGTLEECAGLEYDRFIHSSQQPHLVRTYPEGLGRRLPWNHGIRLQAHYLNTTDSPIEGEVTLTLRIAEPGTVQQYVGQLFMNNMNIDIAPLSPGSASKTCSVPSHIQLLTAAGHMHNTGVYLRSETDDGRLIYDTTEWDEPPFHFFDPPYVVSPATAIFYWCDYENFKDIQLTFGRSAETNEMCIFNADYFPAPDGQNIDCLF